MAEEGESGSDEEEEDKPKEVVPEAPAEPEISADLDAMFAGVAASAGGAGGPRKKQKKGPSSGISSGIPMSALEKSAATKVVHVQRRPEIDAVRMKLPATKVVHVQRRPEID